MMLVVTVTGWGVDPKARQRFDDFDEQINSFGFAVVGDPACLGGFQV